VVGPGVFGWPTPGCELKSSNQNVPFKACALRFVEESSGGRPRSANQDSARKVRQECAWFGDCGLGASPERSRLPCERARACCFTSALRVGMRSGRLQRHDTQTGKTVPCPQPSPIHTRSLPPPIPPQTPSPASSSLRAPLTPTSQVNKLGYEDVLNGGFQLPSFFEPYKASPPALPTHHR
jgi:hypothetical protein